MLVRFDCTPKDEKALAILQKIERNSAVCTKSTGPCGASQPCQGGGAAGTEVDVDQKAGRAGLSHLIVGSVAKDGAGALY